MADMIQIEERLAIVEAGLVRVQEQLGLNPSAGNWVARIAGSLADVPEDEYQQFLGYCRAVRDDISNSEWFPELRSEG